MRRVVITGMGVVSSAGRDLDTFFGTLSKGETVAGPITRFDNSDLPVKIASEITGWDSFDGLDRKIAIRLDRFARYGFAATAAAVTAAKLKTGNSDFETAAIVIGSALGGLETFELEHEKVLTHRVAEASALLIPKVMPNSVASQMASWLGAQGPSFAPATASASGASAIAIAADMVRAGTCDRAICGGAEAPITKTVLAGFHAIGALTKHADPPSRSSRPYDQSRDGFVVGEGAGVVVLEELQAARGRGAPVLAEIVGVGMSSDALPSIAPDPGGRGQRQAMARALVQGRVDPRGVGYLNACGTGTVLSDVAECRAIRSVFGEYAQSMPVSSTKSIIGDSLAASGALELIATVQCMRSGFVHPTANLEQVGEGCELCHVAKVGVATSIDCALTLSSGFGGHNVAIVLKRLDG